MTIRENILARNTFSSIVSGDTQQMVGNAPYGTLDRDSTEIAFGRHYKKPGMVTFEDCKQVFDHVWHERGPVDATTLLQRFGISQVSDLFMGMYGEFYRYARVAIDYGVSPQWAWLGIDDIPEGVRDRWLLLHPDSGSIWEVRGKLANEFGDGSVVDVSGVAEHEAEWHARQMGEQHRGQGFYQSEVGDEL